MMSKLDLMRHRTKNAQFTLWGICKQRMRVTQVKHVRGQVQTSPTARLMVA